MADNPPIDPASPRAVSPSLRRDATNDESSSSRTLDVENPANDTTSPSKPPPSDPPPDGGYGWVCVICNFFINGHTWGVNSSYAVFLSYYLSHDYFPNTSPLDYAFVGGLSVSLAMVVAPLATHTVHLYGTRVCLHVGVFFETLSLISASFAHQKYQLLLSQGVCFGVGIGFLFVGSVGIIPQWFTRKRSLANAIAAAGSGLGGLIYSLASQKMIDTLGLPWAFRVLGIVTFAVNITAANLVRDRNTQVGARHKAFDTKILFRPEFLLMQGWGAFSMLGYVVVLFSLPAYATSIGLTAQQGAIIGALLNLGQMLGRPFIGLASDRWGRLNLATIFTLLEAVFCFAFWIPAEISSSPMGLLSFFAIVGGALAGTFWCTVAPVGAEVLGLPDLPAGLSLTWLCISVPLLVSEPIALEIRRDHAPRWRYIGPQVFAAACYALAALCLWVVRGWRVGEVEEMERRERQDAGAEGANNNGGVVRGEKELEAAAPQHGQEGFAKEMGFSTMHGENEDKAEEAGGISFERALAGKETDTSHTRRQSPPSPVDKPGTTESRTRPRSNSVMKAGWNRRDLFRRMVAWRKA